MATILIIDDEASMREFLEIMLRREGYDVLAAANGEAGLRLLSQDSVDLVITDMRMQEVNGMQVLATVKQETPLTPVILITAFGSTKEAVQAVKQGAFDYITKPFQIDEVKLTIAKALETRRLTAENLYLKRELQQKYRFGNLVGRSPQMSQLFQLIDKIADSRSTVLIQGESGTGKELVARAMHYRGSRRDRPFLTVNCGALPEQLLESELFGHQRGAFTGAEKTKEGLFEVADGGTFLLDEIGETPLAIQVKLLRVLQDKEFKRLGGTKDIRVDVRIIAASNRNLADAVAAGRFREDLFYRLNVIPLVVPPLRERRGDIALLLDHFLEKYCQELGQPKCRLTPEALACLEAYAWPGNVRELENIVARAVTFQGGETIGLESLPEEVTHRAAAPPPAIPLASSSEVDLDAELNRLERQYLEQALSAASGRKTLAAKLLRVSFRSLRYRLKKHRLET
ncbi:MAG: sigma-54-dependent Fis family transcriptional regulator [Candidatus Tectomicrobia bacterium]|nr:sigma-54-dependent Fis family transcriptional regulator [Candidatus Tectomicrobia bacterium]